MQNRDISMYFYDYSITISYARVTIYGYEGTGIVLVQEDMSLRRGRTCRYRTHNHGSFYAPTLVVLAIFYRLLLLTL